MRFVRSIPKLGAFLPELHVFSCPFCGEVETREVVKAARAAELRNEPLPDNEARQSNPG